LAEKNRFKTMCIEYLNLILKVQRESCEYVDSEGSEDEDEEEGEMDELFDQKNSLLQRALAKKMEQCQKTAPSLMAIDLDVSKPEHMFVSRAGVETPIESELDFSALEAFPKKIQVPLPPRSNCTSASSTTATSTANCSPTSAGSVIRRFEPFYNTYHRMFLSYNWQILETLPFPRTPQELAEIVKIPTPEDQEIFGPESPSNTIQPAALRLPLFGFLFCYYIEEPKVNPPELEIVPELTLLEEMVQLRILK
jgi:hypothetical protein